MLAPPPEGFATWDDFYPSLGVPEDGLDHDAVAKLDPGGNEFDINQPRDCPGDG